MLTPTLTPGSGRGRGFSIASGVGPVGVEVGRGRGRSGSGFSIASRGRAGRGRDFLLHQGSGRTRPRGLGSGSGSKFLAKSVIKDTKIFIVKSSIIFNFKFYDRKHYRCKMISGPGLLRKFRLRKPKFRFRHSERLGFPLRYWFRHGKMLDSGSGSGDAKMFNSGSEIF